MQKAWQQGKGKMEQVIYVNARNQTQNQETVAIMRFRRRIRKPDNSVITRTPRHSSVRHIYASMSSKIKQHIT